MMNSLGDRLCSLFRNSRHIDDGLYSVKNSVAKSRRELVEESK